MTSESLGTLPCQTLFGLMRSIRDRTDERSPTNQFVLRALEEEKREGQRIATIARTIALGVIALLLLFLNQTVGVLYYAAFMVAFIAIGWAQLRFARVGRSGTELNIVDVLASDDHDVGAVRNQDVAMVFVDIVGFTEISERSASHQVMDPFPERVKLNYRRPCKPGSTATLCSACAFEIAGEPSDFKASLSGSP